MKRKPSRQRPPHRQPGHFESVNRDRDSQTFNPKHEPTTKGTAEDNEQEHEFGVPFAGTILPPDQWAKTALKKLPATGYLDFVELFGRDAPRVLDVGCGNGRFLLSSAVRRPEVDHIGIDALPVVIRYATRRANMRGLSNCRLAVCDGARFLRQYCAAGSLHEIHVYHPQPYPARGEHRLRLFQHSFLWLIHQSLAPGGRLYVQTDNAAYWHYLESVLPAIVELHSQHGPWPEDPQGRSRREIIARHKGLEIYRGWGVRRDDLTESQFIEHCRQLPLPNFDARHQRNPKGWHRG